MCQALYYVLKVLSENCPNPYLSRIEILLGDGETRQQMSE